MASVNYVLGFACAILLYVHRKKKVVQLAQPFFLALIVFGAMVDTTSIIFMSRDNRTSSKEELNASCVAWPWLLTLGQMLTTATLVAKMFRVKVVTGATAYVTKTARSNMVRKTKVRAKDVSGFIVLGLLVDIIVLAVWYGTDPFRWSFAVTSRDFEGLILEARGQCSSEGGNAWAYPLTIVIIHLAFLVYGNVLAYQTRAFHFISDSKLVAISLFNSIQLLVLATVMVGLSGDNVSISYLIRVCYAFLNNFGVLALVCVPKLYLCVVGKGDETKLTARKTAISGLDNASAVDSRSAVIKANSSHVGNSRATPETDVRNRRDSAGSTAQSDTCTSDRKRSVTFGGNDNFEENEDV